LDYSVIGLHIVLLTPVIQGPLDNFDAVPAFAKLEKIRVFLGDFLHGASVISFIERCPRLQYMEILDKHEGTWYKYVRRSISSALECSTVSREQYGPMELDEWLRYQDDTYVTQI